MEGSYWARVMAIIALMLACAYILTPTFMGSSDVDVGNFNDASLQESEPPLEMWYTTEGTLSAETVDQVNARLVAADVGVIRVADKDDRLVVFMRPGARKAKVEAVMAASAPALEAYALASLDAEHQAPGTRAEASLVDGSAALGLGLSVVQGADGISVTTDADTTAETIVFSGGRAIAEFGPATAGTPAPLAVYLPSDIASLTAVPFAQELTRFVAEVVEVEEEQAEAEEELAWYTPYLPEAKLSLGLDLRGGIDLTLQVDLEEAVFAQVQRDRVSYQDKALEENLNLTIARDRTRPALKFSDASFDEVKSFMNEFARGQYDYVETLQEDGKDIQVWRIAEIREDELKKQAVDQVLETLRKRVDSTGVKEPSIVRMGGGRINVQLPGVDDAQQAIDAIGTQAILMFRLVDETIQVNAMVPDPRIKTAQEALPAEQFDDDDLLNEYLRAEALIEPTQLLMWEYDEAEPGRLVRSGVAYIVQEKVELTGGDVANAIVGYDQNNQPNVILDFKTRGGRLFCDLTRANVNRQFAIILDDQVRSAPNIREPICGGSASIDMGNSANAMADANTLSLVLRTGSLTAPVDIGQVREIGASLGEDAIQAGMKATLIGGALTLCFMALYYRIPGMIADFALVFNVFLVFSLLALFGATLTLPGIAGIALTVGMAVDANIIVYERIREELALGVNARKAVDVGYEKAVVAVLDANITTGIAGIVLYSYGSGPIKGFAVTLMIGIFTTLVTALFVTRTFMEMLTRNSNARLRI